MKSKVLLMVICVLAVSVLLFACSNGGGATPQPAPAPAPAPASGQQNTPAPAAETIYIGAVEPLTGAYGTLGTNMQTAMEIAADIINNKHDIDWDLAQNEGLAGLNNAKISLIWGDCQSDASIAATEAAAILDRGVTGIVGAYASGLSAAVAAQALEYNVPMICGGSSSATLTDGVTYDFGAIFNRIAATDEMESIEFFKYLTYCNEKYDAGIKKVAIAYINNSYGIHADEMFAKYAVEYGFEPVARVSYEGSMTAADTEAAQIIAAKPDVVFQASYIADLTMFAQAYNSYGFSPKQIICYCGGFQDSSFANVATSLNANFYAGGQACSPVLAGKMEIFSYINDLYIAKTGYNIDGPALEDFASVIVMAQAINAAGSAEPTAVIKALREHEFDAPYFPIGKIAFNEFGQNIKLASFVTQLIDGKYEVVYPIDEYTTHEPLI